MNANAPLSPDLQQQLTSIVSDGRLIGPAEGPAVAIVGNAVPLEVLLATGCCPVPVQPRMPVPAGAVGAMEEELEEETRALFASIIAGSVAECELLIIPGSSDGNRFLYQYLKEEKRRGNHLIPPLVTFDILYNQRAIVRDYVTERLRLLMQRLGILSDCQYPLENLPGAIHKVNTHRSALCALQDFREKTGLSGTASLRTFASLQGRSSDAAKPVHGHGPRILLLPALPLLDHHLHDRIEAAGCTIVAEDDWSGARSAVSSPLEPDSGLDAIAEWYCVHAAAPRMPGELRMTWAKERIRSSGQDAVIVFMPPEDQHFGWEFPELRQAAADACLPLLVIDQPDGFDEQVSRFLADVSRQCRGEKS